MLRPGVFFQWGPVAARHEVLRRGGVGAEHGALVPHDRRPPQERPMDEDAGLDVRHVALQRDEDTLVLPTADRGLVAQRLAYTGEKGGHGERGGGFAE